MSLGIRAGSGLEEVWAIFSTVRVSGGDLGHASERTCTRYGGELLSPCSTMDGTLARAAFFLPLPHGERLQPAAHGSPGKPLAAEGLDGDAETALMDHPINRACRKERKIMPAECTYEK